MEIQDSKFQIPDEDGAQECATPKLVYKPRDVWEMLGIGKVTYYKLLKSGVLRSSRLYPGGPRRHTQKQLDEYRDYLNGRGDVSKRLQKVA